MEGGAAGGGIVPALAPEERPLLAGVPLEALCDVPGFGSGGAAFSLVLAFGLDGMMIA